MQAIKTKADDLAALGKPLDHENLIDKVLEGLDNIYQSVIDAFNNRDTPITFDELHEKLIHKELSLRHNSPSLALPTSAHLAHTRSNPRSSTFRPSGPVNNWSHQPTPTQSHHHTPRPNRPFLGKCQWCRTQGHVVSQCYLFHHQFPMLHHHHHRLSIPLPSVPPLLGKLKPMLLHLPFHMIPG
ncbi:hypothetical protein F511_12372 [Dorcoceras hygrometricum]|uniref:Uncharacterized protein n=1 Tax=Dorcoceras hygrometricum TaxID=472368 RepID=A0A2Z7DF07_9LAMI|nr:hypothetical protein F511_12372 [Dorcoceras hygrometricum]